MAGIIDGIKSKFSKLSQLAKIKSILSNKRMQNFIASLSDEQKKAIQVEFAGVSEKMKDDGSLNEGDISPEKMFSSMGKVFTAQQLKELQEIMSSDEMKKIFNDEK